MPLGNDPRCAVLATWRLRGQTLKTKGLGLLVLSLRFIGAPCATRTRDHLIKSQMLYRLS